MAEPTPEQRARYSEALRLALGQPQPQQQDLGAQLLGNVMRQAGVTRPRAAAPPPLATRVPPPSSAAPAAAQQPPPPPPSAAADVIPPPRRPTMTTVGSNTFVPSSRQVQRTALPTGAEEEIAAAEEAQDEALAARDEASVAAQERAAASADALTEMQEEALARDEEASAQRQAIQREALARYDRAAADAIASGRVDPGRWRRENMSAALVIGQALSTLGSSLLGTEDRVARMISDEIDRDIEAQKLEASSARAKGEHARTMYAALLAQLGSEAAADEAMRQKRLALASDIMQRAIDREKIPERRAQLEAERAELERQRALSRAERGAEQIAETQQWDPRRSVAVGGGPDIMRATRQAQALREAGYSEEQVGAWLRRTVGAAPGGAPPLPPGARAGSDAAAAAAKKWPTEAIDRDDSDRQYLAQLDRLEAARKARGEEAGVGLLARSGLGAGGVDEKAFIASSTPARARGMGLGQPTEADYTWLGSAVRSAEGLRAEREATLRRMAARRAEFGPRAGDAVLGAPPPPGSEQQPNKPARPGTPVGGR